MAKTIFITGASRGFGKLWTEAFLQRGDNVAATVRDLSSLDDLVKKYEKALLPSLCWGDCLYIGFRKPALFFKVVQKKGRIYPEKVQKAG